MWVPDLMIGLLLTAHITTCLNYRHSFIALSLFRTYNNLCTQQSSQSLSPSSLHLQLLLLLEHSTTLTALTACTHNYTLQSHCASLADYPRRLKHFSAALPEVHWFPYCQYTHTHWIQLGWFTYIVSERSERTRRKHSLRHLFYCRVTYTS
jgi:hypothetical protein